MSQVVRSPEPVLGELPFGQVRRILVGHPTGVDAVHVDPCRGVVGRGGAGHHVQRGLRHVRVWVARRLEPPVELRRAAHGLARVVEDEVQPVARREQVGAEGLDARRVP